MMKFLNEPFPDSNDIRDNILGGIIAGIAVCISLFFSLPKDVTQDPKGIYLVCAYYAIITLLTCILYNSLIIYIFKIDRETPSWTLWKWILQTMILITCIAIANIIFTHFYFGVSISWKFCFDLVCKTFAIGTVPASIAGILTVVQKKKRYTGLAESLNIQALTAKQERGNLSKVENEISIVSGNTALSIDTSQILFAKSLQNYVQLYYRSDEQVLVETIRKTLTDLESLLMPYGIERCHRSYLVNRSLIQSVSGNAQGLKLNFEGTEEIVSVSRKYVDAFR